MKKIQYWLRWIAVLPGAIIAGILSSFPLHWLLIFLVWANNENIQNLNIETIEYFLAPVVCAIAFVYTGYEIAPKFKIITAFILCGLYILFWLTLFILALLKINFYGMEPILDLRSIFALAGAFCGLYIAKKANDNNK